MCQSHSISKSSLNTAIDCRIRLKRTSRSMTGLEEYSNNNERLLECGVLRTQPVSSYSIDLNSSCGDTSAGTPRLACNGCAPYEHGLIRPRARPCTVSAAAPFTRGAGLHLTSHEYSTRAHAYPSACRHRLAKATYTENRVVVRRARTAQAKQRDNAAWPTS